MRHSIFLLLAICSTAANAQLYFGPERVVAEAETPNAKAIEAGDMDGDGDIDIVVASANDNEISLYANQGGGNFAPQQVLMNDAGGATDVDLGDIDNDGDLDIAFAAQLGDRFAWLKNQGNLQFAPAIDIVPPFYANCAMDIELKDVDLDGDLDAVTAMCAGFGYVMWWTNTNAGTSWGTNATIVATTAAVCVAVGQLDADNFPDVIAGGSGFVWRLNQGTPFVGICGCDNDSNGDAQVNSVAIGPPVNGYSQEYTASAELDNVSISYRPLNDPNSIGDGVVYMQVMDPSFVDVTPLGVIVLSTGTHSAYLNGSDVPIITDAYGARDAAVADFDGDGDHDIAIASSWDCDITWYENTPAGFDGHRITPLAGLFGKPVATDLNGDALPDVAVLQAEGLTWFPNLGLGDFGPAEAVDLNPLLTQMRMADMDQDGDRDLITLSADGNPAIEIEELVRLQWHPNDGTGTFGAPVLMADSFPYQFLDVADMDGDGDTDIITADYTLFHRFLIWIENTGDGTAGDTTAFGSSINLIMLESFDVDNDGDIDVAVVDQQLDALIVYLNNGNGSSFTSSQPPGISFSPTDMAHGDVNNDGLTDIALTYNFGEVINVYHGLGNGSFAAPSGLFQSPTNDITSFDIGDLDGDGDDDFAMSRQDPGEVYVAENLGNGTWGLVVTLATDANWSRYLSITDVGGDSLVDVLLTSALRNAVIWFANGDITTSTTGGVSTATLHAWPIPATGTLRLSEGVSGNVFDMNGRKVRRVHRSSTVELAALVPGVYLLRLDDGRSLRFVVN